MYVQFNAKLMNKQKKVKERNVEVLLAKDDASCAQEWIVDGVGSVDEGFVEGDHSIGPGVTSLGDGMERRDDEMPRRRSPRLRELDEDDFSSEDEVDVEIEFESDDEDRVYGDVQPGSTQVPPQDLT